MAIPVYLQQFKAAGVYRVVFDKSTMTNESTETLRLVVGYSEVGPFNCPVYVKNAQDFVKIFGDISKKLERRGIFFHRLCLQMLAMHPIICLNLKKFNNETVGASTMSTVFNPNYDPIDDVHVNIEDIFDTTRFWELSAEQLNDLRSTEGVTLGNYINISMTDTKANSASYFIRKASGSKVSQYDITVNDWYSDRAEEVPEYLEKMGNNLVSDFFAEIYVFKGKFRASQVLASESLKDYFIATDIIDSEDEGEYILKLRPNVKNAYGEMMDTLDTMYNDPLSNPIGHWVGCLIPYFKDKRGNYQSLDILFNSDQAEHKMMMSFNTDLLEGGDGSLIDLSGRNNIPTSESLYDNTLKNGVNVLKFKNPLSLETIYQGVAKTNLLGNLYAPVISDTIDFTSEIGSSVKPLVFSDLNSGKTNISGSLYVGNIEKCEGEDNLYNVTLFQIHSEATVTVHAQGDRLPYVFKQLGVTNYENMLDIDDNSGSCKGIKEDSDDFNFADAIKKLGGTFWNKEEKGLAYPNEEQIDAEGQSYNGNTLNYIGPKKIISSIRRLESFADDETSSEKTYTDIDTNFDCSFRSVSIQSEVTNSTDSIYGASVSFITKNSNWKYNPEYDLNGGIFHALYCEDEFDNSLQLVLKKGDCILADDGAVDKNDNHIVGEDEDKDQYYDTVYVQGEGTKTDEDGNFISYYILLSGAPLNMCGIDGDEGWVFEPEADGEQTIEEWDWADYDGSDAEEEENPTNVTYYIIRIDAPLNQEIGELKPHYLEGYIFKNDRPNGTDMYAKLEWQKEILSTLSVYKGLRVGLLNKAEIDYRYVIDTFESFPQEGLKKEFASLCRDKESAFCIANLPAIKTFVKCPYTSFTDNGIFNPQYIVDGRNRKRPCVELFSLPSEIDGASFIAFYTPLKFSDGYVDTVVPSAGLVSNLFMEKYMSRQPYYIVAGPNYGNIKATGLVGPDYKFSREELYILEPYGFNCMIYRPSFGTFINANQTAKQTPLSALSRVNVRELVIYLQDEVEKVLQSYQWEFNNATTRNAILDKANQICALIQANGGIQTYLNIMDESNNTPEIIDNEMAVLSTHIEPGFGCGKMVHELTLYRTGQMASQVIESK